MIDTGAAVPAISAQVYDKLQTDVKTTLISDAFCMFSVPVLGKIQLPFAIDKQFYQFSVFVAHNLGYDVILGKDFLLHYNAIIDLQSKTLTLSDGISGAHTLAPTKPVLDQCTLHLVAPETLQTLSETIVAAQLKRPFDPGVTGIIEPKRTLADKYHVCGGVILATISETNTIPVRLLNPTTATIPLYQGMNIGLFTRLDNPTIGALFDNSDHSEHGTPRVEGVALQFDLTESELPDDQKTQLLRLLNSYRDIFAL